MRKNSTARRAAKRTSSRKARRAAPVKAKTARRARKTARRVTMFKSTSWYQIAAQSIGISPRAAQ